MNNKFGIIIIDVWNGYHPHHAFLEDLIEHYVCNIANLLDNVKDAARPKRNIPVALCVYEGGSFASGPHHMIAHRVAPNPSSDNKNRISSTNQNTVITFFKSNSIETLYYAGYSLPGCIEERSVGLKEMSQHFICKIIADCTLDLYNSPKHNYDRINSMYHYMAQKKYQYVFSDDLIKLFNSN